MDEVTMAQMSPTQQGFSNARSSYVPTTPQLRRYADYTPSSISPQMHRRSSPSKANYGRASPTKQNYGVPLKPPMSDIDSVQLPQILYLQKSPLETHKCRMQNKLKYALLSQAVLCFISSITAYFGFIYASRDVFPFDDKAAEDKVEVILGYELNLFQSIKHALFVASWSTFLSSIGILFVVGLQLFFAFKIVKNQPDSASLALNFLAEGKYVRTVAIFVWFLSFICFIFLIQAAVHVIPLQLVPKVVVACVGIVIALICIIAAIQAFYQIFHMDYYIIPTHFSMDERYDLDAVGGHYARGNMNFSTLV